MRRRCSPSSRRRAAHSPTGMASPPRSAEVSWQRTAGWPPRSVESWRRHHPLLPPTGSDMLDLDALNFAKGDGLVTVVTQDVESGAVLMVAHADREALQHT